MLLQLDSSLLNTFSLFKLIVNTAPFFSTSTNSHIGSIKLEGPDVRINVLPKVFEDGTWEDEHAMMKTKITRPKVHQA